MSKNLIERLNQGNWAGTGSGTCPEIVAHTNAGTQSNTG